MTPLALAFLHNNLRMAKHLHAAGASPLPEHNNDESLACFAIMTHNPALIHWLASLGQTDPIFNTPGPDGNCRLNKPALPVDYTWPRGSDAARESAVKGRHP
jgi:ankyrin repeat protein